MSYDTDRESMETDTSAFAAYELTSRYTQQGGTVLMSGVQALARLPIDQLRADRRRGLDTAAFVSGYPGSPLGIYDRAVAAAVREVPELPVVHRPALNEELAATAIMGSQLACTRPGPRYDGVLGIWYGKGPGVDRAGDAIRHGAYVGADPHGGVVVLAGDDPTAKSSTIPSSSGGVLANMSIPVLHPGDPSEALDLGRHAIALSRSTGLWTGLKITTNVADGIGTVRLDPDRVTPVVPLLDGRPYDHRPDWRLLPPHTVDIEREMLEVRYPLAVQYGQLNGLNRTTVDPHDAWIGVISMGITYRELREALARLGLDTDAAIADAGIRLLYLTMPRALDRAAITRFARGLDEIVVVEEKHPDIETLVKSALYSQAVHPPVVGKHDGDGEPLFPGYGALAADDIVAGLRRRLERRLSDRLAPEASRRAVEIPLVPLEANRTPYFCSGCPHNRSNRVPDGSAVGAGIGCSAMVAFMDPERFGEVVMIGCMGGEGSQWIGMAPFVEASHMFQNMGDGTFFHSGQLAIQAAVAAGVTMTYKLLWNDAVAMTGGQDAEGRVPVSRVATTLLAQGVARVVITTDDTSRYRRVALPSGVDVWPRSRLMEAQRVLRDTPGVTVLIHDQTCAAEARRRRKRGTAPTPNQRVVINHRLCEGCGDCGDISNCLSVQPIETPYGRKTAIDQASCNLDYSCLEGDCPAFMTVTTGPSRRRRTDRPHKANTGASSGPGTLPDPMVVVDTDDVSVRIAGIGGTGVVTASQLVATAAMFDGYDVGGLDQTGLSQKAGPVVSDLRLTKGRTPDSNRLGVGGADLLLAFDQMVAATPGVLIAGDQGRTAVVGSTTVVPTGAVVSHPDEPMPGPDELAARIAGATAEGKRHWADAGAITTGIFGDATTANVFVLGMAIQAGYLPVSVRALVQAIELNGVAVQENLAALRWGRAQVAAPDDVAAAMVRRTRSRPDLDDDLVSRIAGIADGDGSLERLMRMLAGDLVGWQNRRVAISYLDEVAAVVAREREAVPGSTSLTEAFARGLHKLTAYKDEYEVARLMLDPEGTEAAHELAASTGGRVSWRLHPPVFRVLGRSSKVSFGSWSTPLFAMLMKMKWARGHWYDPFGHSEVRRTERELPGEYLAAMNGVLVGLDAGNLDRAVEVARLPEMVRGYEDIKMRSVAVFRARLAEAAETGARGNDGARP